MEDCLEELTSERLRTVPTRTVLSRAVLSRTVLTRTRSLRLAGLTAIGTACYHAVSGDAIIKNIDMKTDDMSFVSSTYQLGTMGWVAGGVLLIGASRMDSAQARNWIVGVTSALYGFPALGTLMLTGGKPNVGGAALATAVALALYGRKLDTPAVPPSGVGRVSSQLTDVLV